MGKTTFVDKDAASGVSGTIIPASFMNAVNTHYHDGLAIDGHGALPYAADSGAANAYIVTLSPVLAQYVVGMPLYFLPAASNTGACTVNFNSLGVCAIKKRGSVALVAGDIIAGEVVCVIYDGTNFQLQNTPLTELRQRVWAAGTTYAVGDVVYPSAWDGRKRMECVVAGTSGTSEPAWTACGAIVVDGGVTWIVDDSRDGTPVGRVLADPVLTLRPGYIYAAGTLLSRSVYPRLWAWAQAYGRVVSETEWAANNWGCFASGDAATATALAAAGSTAGSGYVCRGVQRHHLYADRTKAGGHAARRLYRLMQPV